MSTAEDTSLRDLVSQTLTATGVLPKIKAELRANVFLALEKNEDVCEKLLHNKELGAFSRTEKGVIILNLIREFLQYFHLDFTLAVFEPETCYGSNYNEINRDDLIKKCKLADDPKIGPLLYDLINWNGLPVEGGDMSRNMEHSPGLNSTYIKPELGLVVTPKQSLDYEDDKIASLTPSDRSSEDSPKTPVDRRLSPINSNSNLSTPPNEKQNESFNLLSFTPVQEVKAVLKEKKDVQLEKTEKKTVDQKMAKNRTDIQRKTDNGLAELRSGLFNKDEKERKGPTKSSASSLSDLPPLSGFGKSSSLNDLPPLGAAAAGTEKNMKDLKGLIEGLKELTEEKSGSQHSNTEENGKDTPDSDRTIASDEVEEDISESVNCFSSSDGQSTEDLSISRLSNHSKMDYVESV